MMVRIISIWIFGLLGSGFAGAVIGSASLFGSSENGGIAGVCLFACIRLWAKEPKEI